VAKYSTLRVEKEGSLCRIIFNRPDKFNAINSVMADEIESAFRDFKEDQTLRVGIITGNGKAFMAGADLEEIAARTPEENEAYNLKIMHAFSMLEHQPKPVIAAINGFALGGGLELALACTFRLASQEAKMGLPEVKLGILPGAGGTQRLPRAIGKQQALRLILTGETITSEEGLRIGILLDVVPADLLMSKAQELAEKILQNGPKAVTMAKDAVECGLQMNLDQALAYTNRNLTTLSYGEEMKEGIKAFIERRPPSFSK